MKMGITPPMWRQIVEGGIIPALNFGPKGTNTLTLAVSYPNDLSRREQRALELVIRIMCGSVWALDFDRECILVEMHFWEKTPYIEAFEASRKFWEVAAGGRAVTLTGVDWEALSFPDFS